MRQIAKVKIRYHMGRVVIPGAHAIAIVSSCVDLPLWDSLHINLFEQHDTCSVLTGY
jgi:hypothetical protein